ncbi:MAG: glutathione ABC transporter permease GsiC [Anaerolinea sp.]|nr:glutathione ABC transporter permease GsiC [Anaerolinea sp.]
MTQYFLRRLLLAFPTIFLVIFATFLIVRLVPGDVVSIMMAERPYAVESDRELLRKELGVDKPVVVQFVIYLGKVARGDLGESPWTQRPVTDELGKRLPVTAQLGVFAIFLGLLIAVPVGILSAVRQDSMRDYAARSFAILALSVPSFFTATLLIVFPLKWFSWSPPLIYKGWSEGPLDHIYYFFFPALLLGVGLAGGVMRLTRTMMLEVLRQDYIRTAWAKGLRERSVILHHVTKNAFIPVVTFIGLQVGVAVSGSIIIESIFNMPGVGKFFVGAIFQRDYPSVQGVVLILATVIVFVNLLVDLTYAYLDPRIRYA